MDIPKLQLSAGQALWVINQGRTPGPQLRNEARYLRRLGIPHDEDQVSQGRGHRLLYTYEDIVELGVALFALRRGMKPKDVAEAIKQDRASYRQIYREALADKPPAALAEEWVRSRGKIRPVFANDLHMRLHARMRDTPSRYEIVVPDINSLFDELFDVREVHTDGADFFLVPLTRLAIEYLAWALEAPVIKPGRTARVSD